MSLTQSIRQVLAELELTSNGKTYTYGGSHHGFGETPPSTGDPNPPHVVYRISYEECTNDLCRVSVIRRAHRALKEIQHTQAGSATETEAQRNRRLIKEGEGFSAEEVAVAMRMKVTEVWKTRLGFGRDKETGVVDITQRMALASPAERRARAKLLKDEHGMSARQIALLLDVSHTQILLDLRRAA